MPMHDWTTVLAGIYHDFHQRWIVTIADALNDGRLPPDHYALAEQIADGPEADVLTLESTDNRPDFSVDADEPSHAVALAEHPPKVRYTEQDERDMYARKADRVAVFHASGDRVVGYVEIVSPGNKHSYGEFEKFMNKLGDALSKGIHLLIIDPHPPSNRDPRGIHAAFWERRMGTAHGVTEEQPLGLSAYRAGIHTTAYFEPFAVGDSLLDMPLFLTPDHYVNCPLESTYMAAWKGVPQRWKTVIEAQGERGASAP